MIGKTVLAGISWLTQRPNINITKVDLPNLYGLQMSFDMISPDPSKYGPLGYVLTLSLADLSDFMQRYDQWFVGNGTLKINTGEAYATFSIKVAKRPGPVRGEATARRRRAVAGLESGVPSDVIFPLTSDLKVTKLINTNKTVDINATELLVRLGHFAAFTSGDFVWIDPQRLDVKGWITLAVPPSDLTFATWTPDYKWEPSFPKITDYRSFNALHAYQLIAWMGEWQASQPNVVYAEAQLSWQGVREVDAVLVPLLPQWTSSTS